MYINLVIAYMVIHPFIHQTFVGPLSTVLSTACTTHAVAECIVQEIGIRKIKNCIITILINTMKKNIVPFVKYITEQGLRVLTFLWASVIRFVI